MFDKLFLNLAERQLTHVSVTQKLSRILEEPLIRKATVKTLENGDRLVDMRIITAGHMKLGALITLGCLAAGAAGNVLGGLHSQN